MSYVMTLKRSKVSEILQKLMQVKEIHVAELARRLNLKQPTVQRVATGVYQKPHTKTLKPIADFFGITIEQLVGESPISWLPSKDEVIGRIPIISPLQAAHWPCNIEAANVSLTLVDIEISKNSYAMRTPDASMEPLFPKGTLLIIDPDREPKDRCYVIVRRNDYQEVVFRQLLIDGMERYLKPLSPNLEHFKMAMLNPMDAILGVLVQARLDYGE